MAAIGLWAKELSSAARDATVCWVLLLAAEIEADGLYEAFAMLLGLLPVGPPTHSGLLAAFVFPLLFTAAPVGLLRLILVARAPDGYVAVKSKKLRAPLAWGLVGLYAFAVGPLLNLGFQLCARAPLSFSPRAFLVGPALLLLASVVVGFVVLLTALSSA